MAGWTTPKEDWRIARRIIYGVLGIILVAWVIAYLSTTHFRSCGPKWYHGGWDGQLYSVLTWQCH